MIQIVLFWSLFFSISCFSSQQDTIPLNSTTKFEKRVLQQSYCQDYHSIIASECIRCKDSFNLPSCSTCPKGLYQISDLCMKCPKGSLNCDNNTNQLYCYNGFVKEGDKCICNKLIKYDWCTTDYFVHYYTYYRIGGELVSKFSVEIFTLNSLTDTSQYEFNTNNCAVISNKSLFSTIQNSMTCRIDPLSKNLFVISLKSSRVQDKEYLNTPQFDIKKLYIKAGQLIDLPQTITFQKTNLINNDPYFELNKIVDPQCYFKSKQYRFKPGQAKIPKEDFIVNGYKESEVTFEIVYNSQDIPTEKQSLLDGLNMYPNDMIFTFASLASNNLLEEYYQVRYECTLAFGIKHSGKVTIQKIKDFGIQAKLRDIAPKYLPNEISYYFKLIPKTQDAPSLDQLNYEINMNDRYYFKLQLFNKQGQLEYDLPEIIVSDGDIPIYIMRTPEFQQQLYDLIIDVSYFQDRSISYQTIYEIEIGEALEFGFQILPGNLFEFNPFQELTITKTNLDQDFTYLWDIYNLVTGELKTLDSTIQAYTQPTLYFPSQYFNVSTIYYVVLKGTQYSFEYNQQIQYNGCMIISTIQPNMEVIFNTDYLSYGINANDLLSFTEVYDQVQQFNRNNLIHYFTINYVYDSQNLISSPEQSEPQFYFYLNQYFSQYKISDPAYYFQVTFFVKDKSNQQIAFSKKFVFFMQPFPNYCFLDSTLNNQEKSFTDQITFTVRNCYNSLQDGILYYQFLYYIGSDEIDQENKAQQLSIPLTRRYLTNYSTSNTFTTYFPPGSIYLYVFVKDTHESVNSFYVNFEIQNSSFDKSQYEEFLHSQESQMDSYKDNHQFDQELCTISLIIECIKTFEKDNPDEINSEYVIQLKIKLKNRLLALPSLILSNSLNQNLQEFILRCLDTLYNTKNSPDSDNLPNRIKDLQTIIVNKYNEIFKFNNYLPQTQFTYIQQMRVATEIIGNYIPEINKSPPSDIVSWISLQIDTLLLIQEIIALSLNVNQPKIEWIGSFVQLITQRVDTQVMIRDYLLDLGVPLTREFDSRIIFDVILQYWNENPYAKDPAFLAITQPFQATASAALKVELDRVYAAIQPLYISQYDVVYYYRRRILRIEEQEQLILPADTTLKYQFDQVKGNGVVICTQRIKQVWSVKSCKTEKVKNSDDTFKVSCICSSPSFTTLVYDVTTLFIDNKNIDNIFSEQGIANITSTSDWYKYAAFYTIIGINITLILSIIMSIKLDKASGLLAGGALAGMLKSISTKVQPMTLETEQNQILIGNEIQNISTNQNKIAEKELTLLNDNQKDRKNFKNDKDKMKVQPELNQEDLTAQNNHTNFIKESQLITNSDQRNQNENINLNLQQNPTSKNVNLEIDTSIQQINDKENLSRQGSIFQIPSDKALNEVNSQRIKDEDATLLETDKQEQQNFQKQGIDQASEQQIVSIKPQLNNQEKNKIDISKQKDQQNEEQQQMEESDEQSEKKEEEQSQQLEQSKSQIQESDKASKQKQLSQQYMDELTLLKGISVFHIILQIIFIYNKRMSRAYRFGIYYSNIVWTLTINATFGSNISISQVIILAVISTATFAIYNTILEALQSWKYGRYTSIFFTICLLVFCYYATFVSIFSSDPYDANMFILSFFLTLGINIFILGTLISIIKYYISKKLISKFNPTHFLFSLTSADIIFEAFS